MKNIPDRMIKNIVASYFIMNALKEDRGDGVKVLSCEYDLKTNTVNYTALLPAKIHNIECEISISE